VTVSVIGLVELIERSPVPISWLRWALTIVTITAGIACSVLPWRRFPARVQVALVSVFVIAGAMLFPFASDSVAVALVYLASATAGEKVASRPTALVIAGTGTVVAAIMTWLAATVLHVPTGVSWWLSLTVGLSVYIGSARQDRTEALAAAELAARQSRRAAASEAREAALEERGRIAREIHDVLGHSLSGIALQLDMADALHKGGRDPEANDAVRRARALAVSGIGETRRAIHALREGTLPLTETVAQLARTHSAGFEVDGVPGDVRVEVAQAVIRAAQEAVTNAHRHAHGAEVTMVLAYSDDRVRLTVTDTGATDDVQPDDSGSGMGLVGMRERASLLGGTLYAGPSDPAGPGWTVRLELPR
jgi:signal transduction histidine kinase